MQPTKNDMAMRDRKTVQIKIHGSQKYVFNTPTLLKKTTYFTIPAMLLYPLKHGQQLLSVMIKIQELSHFAYIKYLFNIWWKAWYVLQKFWYV